MYIYIYKKRINIIYCLSRTGPIFKFCTLDAMLHLRRIPHSRTPSPSHLFGTGCRTRYFILVGWDRKNGIELTPYEINFLKDITTDGIMNSSFNHSIIGFSKHVVNKYLTYIKVAHENKSKQLNDLEHEFSKGNFHPWTESNYKKQFRKYLWKCNTFLDR